MATATQSVLIGSLSACVVSPPDENRDGRRIPFRRARRWRHTFERLGGSRRREGVIYRCCDFSHHWLGCTRQIRKFCSTGAGQLPIENDPSYPWPLGSTASRDAHLSRHKTCGTLTRRHGNVIVTAFGGQRQRWRSLSQMILNDGMASLRMALPLVLRDNRSAAAQSGDLSLDLDMGRCATPLLPLPSALG